ncbi:ABC transporter substrate-binding protein [Pararhodobacter oceanensis]|uniref:ABC transporter substrate-binding protein n=1 Tax=Pararhodobacter oceanensis TaxID=2172121 RepID=UPI003A957A19
MTLKLSIAMGDYDRTRPLFDRRVQIDGVDPLFLLQSPEEMFFNAFRHRTCDVTELSLSSYCVSLTRDDPPYIGIPVFLSRAFRHSSVYVREDRGIESPGDLAGKRIGLAEYQLTANVWVRAILAEAGVTPDRITWLRGGMNAPGRPEKIRLDLPADVTVEQAPEGATLNQMLVDGAIDGFIGPRWPACFHQGHPMVRRLWRDGLQAARVWHAQTGHFPIMHILGLRRELAAQHPWLPGALLKAFTLSKQAAQAALADTSATKVTMPFVEDILAVSARMSADIWSYGVAENRATLAYFLRHHHAQGLSGRLLEVDELFHPSTLESYSL